MAEWTLYNAKLHTLHTLTDEEAERAKKFYKINFPAWDDYNQKFVENNWHNERFDMFLWRKSDDIKGKDKGLCQDISQ